MSIRIQKSKTADTRTCDFANVSKDTLLASSKQHIGDVRRALDFFMARVYEAGQNHDPDKLTDIDGFHADFVTGFKQTGWWDRHRKLNRHHLQQEDGIPADINLIDVLDFIADCVMAGMARSGSVYELKLPPELLERAFQNTVELLKRQIIVEESPHDDHRPDGFAGQPFKLRSWQERIVRQLFSINAKGVRKHRTALLMLPRKNGKSELAAAEPRCASYCPECDGVALPPASAGLVTRLHARSRWPLVQDTDRLILVEAADALTAKDRELAEVRDAQSRRIIELGPWWSSTAVDINRIVARAEQAEADLTACQRERDGYKATLEAAEQYVARIEAALETLRTGQA